MNRPGECCAARVPRPYRSSTSSICSAKGTGAMSPHPLPKLGQTATAGGTSRGVTPGGASRGTAVAAVRGDGDRILPISIGHRRGGDLGEGDPSLTGGAGGEEVGKPGTHGPAGLLSPG